jgi:ABC-type transporter Mla MlaB component
VKSTQGDHPVDIVLDGVIARGDIPGLCEHASSQIRGEHGRVILCDVGGIVDPDAVAVDAVARLQLTAKRLGCELHLRGAGAELLELIALAGLSEIVPLASD